MNYRLEHKTSSVDKNEYVSCSMALVGTQTHIWRHKLNIILFQHCS